MTKRVTLKISGMSCISCAQTIEDTLNKNPYVANATVNFALNKALLDIDDKIDIESITKTIRDLGYDAEVDSFHKITRNFKVKGMSCTSCAQTIEETLNKAPGIYKASVNLATEKAHISYDPVLINPKRLMDIVQDLGYKLVITEEHSLEDEDSYVNDAKRRMLWSWILTGPSAIVMLFEMYRHLMIPYFDIVQILISLLVIFWIGRNVIKSSITSILHRVLGMDVLIALGTTASFATGIMNLLGINISNYSLVGSMIMSFHLLGKYLEMSAKGRASQAIKQLIKLGAKDARVIRDTEEISVPIEELEIGDILIVRPGEKVPTDGVIIEGETYIDESMVTGESIPVRKTVKDNVIGATINQLGAMKVKVTKLGDDTFLSQIIKLVEEAQGTKVPIQEFAEKVTRIFVPVVLTISAVTFLLWLIFPQEGKNILLILAPYIPWINPGLNPISQAIAVAVSTLVIACPCALGLATPTALMVGSGIGARNGILIRNGEAIQTMKDINAIVFDKTGTITKGVPEITYISSNLDEKDFLRIIASIENNSEHPLGKAIVDYARKKSIEFPDLSSFEVIPGKGIKASIGERRYIVGSPRFILENGYNMSLYKGEIDKLEKDANSVILLADEVSILGVVGIADTLKENSIEAIREIKSMGIRTIMLTGDNKNIALAIASRVGIDDVVSDILPEQKLNIIKELQAKGFVVAMAGDGINDAPALRQANVGIAMGTGTDIAIESGDIVLVKGDVFGVVKAIKLSRETFRKIRQNLFWAFFYNTISIPLASLGFLHPIIAEMAMAFSSVNVITNSLRLRRVKL